MAKIKEFRGYQYNQAKVSNMQEVVAPLFDLISSAEQEQLYAAYPYNMIRLNLGKQFPKDTASDNRYTRSAEVLQEWIKKEILIPSTKPALYIYTIKLPDKSIPLLGLLGLVELEEFGTGKIHPHENTLKAPVEDRIELVRQCKSYFDPIFGLYQEDTGTVRSILTKWIANRKSEFSVRDKSEAAHQVWTLDDPQSIEQIKATLLPNSILIADGHHRYQSALQYRAEQKQQNPQHTGSEPYNYTLMFLANLNDPGLGILPTHRMLKNLPKDKLAQVPNLFADKFTITELPFSKNNRTQQIELLINQMHELGKTNHVFGLYIGNDKLYKLSLKEKSAVPKVEIDVTIFNNLILQQGLNISKEDVFSGDYLRYTKDVNEAIQAVDIGKAQLAFILNPVKIEQVQQIVYRGEKMPQKSTYFIPKPLTGLVIYSFAVS